MTDFHITSFLTLRAWRSKETRSLERSVQTLTLDTYKAWTMSFMIGLHDIIFCYVRYNVSLVTTANSTNLAREIHRQLSSIQGTKIAVFVRLESTVSSQGNFQLLCLSFSVSSLRVRLQESISGSISAADQNEWSLLRQQARKARTGKYYSIVGVG